MTLDFASFRDILSNPFEKDIPDAGADGVFERARQILAKSRQNGHLAYPDDFMALVRHILRRRECQTGATVQLRVPAGPGWPRPDDWSRHGILAHSVEKGAMLLEARPYSPNWLDAVDCPLFEKVYSERQVRPNWQCPMDPFLAEVSGFGDYVSPGQREAVRSAFLMPEGEALLVALPTGSGKSFIAQAPMLARRRVEGGLVLCIVPTTALALDQARQMRDLISHLHPHTALPEMAWHGALDEAQRAEIKSSIRKGRQGILYCSPEAMVGALLPALYDAAAAGLIDYLVVDEVHLVAQWGDNFRPAFQMVSGCRKGLLAACRGKVFRTILMSATLTPDTVRTIDTLFGPARRLQMVSSIHLRPEPQYWIHREDDPGRKTEKVLEVLRHAPRPFILYTTTRTDAQQWARRLRLNGFGRIDCFHGGTNNTDRLRIIDHWSNNRLDGMVATSAFGVGIDKSDVRTVVHAAVPETLDRFYQEVGRGGRDGAPSASILIYSETDWEIAKGIASPSLIGAELAYERWTAMYEKSRSLSMLGARLEVDISVVPPRLRQQSDYNRAWNMRTLVMMARAGMLELDSVAPEIPERLESETEQAYERRLVGAWEDYFNRVVVTVNEPGQLDEVRFAEVMEGERKRASASAQADLGLLQNFLSTESEVSELLDLLYRSNSPGRSVTVSRACGGCPAHRRGGKSVTHLRKPTSFGVERVMPHDLSLWAERFGHLSRDIPVVVPVDADISDAEIFRSASDLVTLFGFREIGCGAEFRRAHEGFERLHRALPDPVLLLQDIDEEMRSPSLYALPRMSIWIGRGGRPVPDAILGLSRPLHVIFAESDTPDRWHFGRKIADTGENILTLEQLKAGCRR